MNLQSKTIGNILILGIFVLLAYLVFSDRGMTVNMTTSESEKTISVTGTAEKFVAPDTAAVSFSITKKSNSTDAATESVNERMRFLMKELKGKKVEEKDIKTLSYNVRPEYVYNDGQRRFDGYRVTQEVDVIIRNLDMVSGVLAIVNSAQLDRISDLRLFVDKDEEIKEGLRNEAIADAKEKAKKLSKELGVNLKVIVGFHENNAHEYNQPKFEREFARSANDGISSEPIISEGENQFVKNVTVEYLIQ